MSRPTIDDLKKRRDGTIWYDPTQDESQEEQEARDWVVQMSGEAEVQKEIIVEAETEDEAMELAEDGYGEQVDFWVLDTSFWSAWEATPREEM